MTLESRPTMSSRTCTIERHHCRLERLTIVSMRSLRRAIFVSIRLAVGGLRLTCAKPGERGGGGASLAVARQVRRMTFRDHRRDNSLVTSGNLGIRPQSPADLAARRN